jgi:hypothetical protein
MLMGIGFAREAEGKMLHPRRECLFDYLGFRWMRVDVCERALASCGARQREGLGRDARAHARGVNERYG